MLEKLYSSLRKETGIDECVLAYRPSKGCNIHMANEVFEEIKQRNNCLVLSFDISGFFDSIDHKKLKKQGNKLHINERKTEIAIFQKNDQGISCQIKK